MLSKVRPTLGGTSDCFLAELASVEVKWQGTSRPRLFHCQRFQLFTNEVPKHGYLHSGQLKVLRGPCALSAILHSVSGTAGLHGDSGHARRGGWGAPCRTRPAALSRRLPDAAGHRGAHSAAWRRRQEPRGRTDAEPRRPGWGLPAAEAAKG